ncbi:MAG: hypothetical protein HUU35_19905 [Armatimonadetes bacterium]|nr:hypothetical protein [Armatimonadota bacterium]
MLAGARGPLVIAHRGFSEQYPENTRISFAAALEYGIDGSECDVHRSRDGVVYLLHDHTLARTAGLDQPADALDWGKLTQLDAGGWKDPRFAGERLPALDQILELHAGRGTLVIELKALGEMTQLVEGTLASIDRTNAYGGCSIISFDRDAVTLAAEREPRVPCLLLLSEIPDKPADRTALLVDVLARRLRGLSVYHRALDAAFVREAHRLALTIWTWTVNGEAVADEMAAMGVDAICTDRPGWLKAHLAKAGRAAEA